jgi:glycosyltransferase involved in cell wall biosynthesis
MSALVARKPFYLRIAGDYAWEQGTQRYSVQETLDAFVKKTPHAFPVRFLKWVQTFIARRARRIVVPSQYLQSIVEMWGIPSKKISVVHNAPLAIPQTLSLSEHAPKSPYVVTVARLVPWKGMAGLIRAFAGLSSEDLRLLVIGAGPQEQELKALVKEKSLGEHVLFAGALPQEETLSLVSGAEAFVLNTNYEGFSHTLLEVFALGVPVLSTLVGGNRELLVHEKNALVFGYDDEKGMQEALTRIQKEADLRLRLTREAKQTLKEFSRERTVRETRTALSLI